ncbi:MAG: hypothetical protein ABIP81_01225 [Terriglobales bacterium]
MANKKKPTTKKSAKKGIAPRSKSAVPKSYPLSDEMKQWCALLTQELNSWAQVDVRKMFGMTSFYRRDAIFAAVPATKAFFSPNSIIFKLQTPTQRQRQKLTADTRVNLTFGIGQKWYGYELGSSGDINGALEWLDEAFRATKAPVKAFTKPAPKRTA